MNNYTIEHISFPSTDAVSTISGVIYIPAGTPKGILQISHGMCEYIGRYDDFMGFMANQGFVVAGHDHLGHGDSSKETSYGYFGKEDGYRNLVVDLHRMTVLLKQKYPSLPCFLLGHSMGSFIARLYLSEYADELAGAIICGTGGPNPMSKSGMKLANLVCRHKGDGYRSTSLDRMAFGSYNKKCKPQRTSKDWLTRDDAIVDKYLRDPKCMFLFTAAGFRDLMTLATLANRPEWFRKLDHNLPILLIAGDMDPVGNYGKGVQEVYSRLMHSGSKDVEMILYPGARHEILNETNRNQVYSDTADWIGRTLLRQKQKRD